MARRYARALLDVTLANPKEGTPERVRQDLEEARALFGGNKELASVLQNPAVGGEAKKKIVAGLNARTKSVPVVGRLLTLLAERDRLSLLPQITDAFGEVWNAQRGVTTAEAVSAIALQPAQAEALSAALGKAAGLVVELKTRLDPQVLGGLVVHMGGKTYDGSVRGRLQALRETLLGRAG